MGLAGEMPSIASVHAFADSSALLSSFFSFKLLLIR